MARYSRQTIMPEIGEAGQKKLQAATVAIVGVGALGSVQAELLARAGVGKLIMIDFDMVEIHNLARQALYTNDDIGEPKAEAAKARIEAINPDVKVTAFVDHLEVKSLRLLEPADLVLDGTDNMETRFVMNEYCLAHDIPVIFVSAVRDRGNVFVVDRETNPDSPCYACLFDGRKAEDDCCNSGVMNGATHLAGTIAATEATKLLLGLPTLDGLFSFSLLDSRFDTFKAKKRPDCSCK